MKKLISVALALTLLFSVFVPAVIAAPAPGIWNAEKNRFELHDPPVLVRIAEDSNKNGTRTVLYFSMSDESMALAESYYKHASDMRASYAEAFGADYEDVQGSVSLSVQIAYSFDGVNWVNDWNPDTAPEDPYYSPKTDFDLDGDKYNEYRYMPNTSLGITERYYDREIFNGRYSHMTAYYCDNPEGMTIEEALTIRNNAILQGRGEFCGSYDKTAPNADAGFMVDFSKNTLYVKARYRVYNTRSVRVDGTWTNYGGETCYSEWSEVKTYHNDNRTYEGQDCVPDMTALKTDAPLVLTPLSSERVTYSKDGVQLTGTRYRFSIRCADETYAALARYSAMGGSDRQTYTGEVYTPSYFIEMKVGDGDWYYLTSVSYGNPFFEFSDSAYWIQPKMEAQGYQPGDPVYLRARLWGSFSAGTQSVGQNLDVVAERDTVYIRTGLSNEVEMSLNGKYNVRYATGSGGFANGTTQLTQFDDDTNVVVDLTTADYTPEQRHFAFRGWYTAPDFAPGSEITSFDTSLKISRTYYAKWEELPWYSIAYDMGVITGGIYNPNPDRIYPDDGEAHNGVIALGGVTYNGAEFLGWFNAPAGGERIETLDYASLTGDTTLYAHWELPTFTITYAGEGEDYTNNERNPATFRTDPDKGARVALYAPEKKGHIFDGWFYNEDLIHNALSYDSEAQAWLMTEGKDVTVYAKWILGRWSIHYELDLDDAWNGANPENYTYGTAVELKDPVRRGYTFNGWFADPEFEHEIVSVAADSEGEITVYAKWTAIRYQIVYDLRDEKIVEFFQNGNPAERTVDDEVVLQPLAPINGRYKFLGWYDNVNFDGKPVEKIDAGTDENVTLYAKLYRYTWGDVDCDGKVTASDARLLLRKAVDLIDEEFTDDLIPWSDFDADGKITASDARTALRMAVDLDTVESLGLPEAPEGI